MVLIRVLVTHVFSRFSIFEDLNGVLTEYNINRLPLEPSSLPLKFSRSWCPGCKWAETTRTSDLWFRRIN